MNNNNMKMFKITKEDFWTDRNGKRRNWIKYMKSDNIDIQIDIFNGSKNFTVYTMDFTKKYIEINSDYRS